VPPSTQLGSADDATPAGANMNITYSAFQTRSGAWRRWPDKYGATSNGGACIAVDEQTTAFTNCTILG
jgi:hypothetical protein